jgi:hypothetical protein
MAADFETVSRRMLEWEIETPPDRAAPAGTAPAAFAKQRPRRRVRVWMWALGGVTAAIAALVLVSRPGSQPQLNSLIASRSAFAIPAQMQTRAAQEAARAAIQSKPMIARTAQIMLTTREFDTTRKAIDEILQRHRGYMAQLNVSTPSASGRTIDATLRVPSDQLEATLAEVRQLGHVETESQNGEEVTSQFVDLEARLANSRNTEQRLTRLLADRTGKLADVLAVETEIGRVRGEIEQMDAERKSLLKRVDFATLIVAVREDYQAQLHLAPKSLVSRMRNAAVEGYRLLVEGLSAVALFLLSWGPSLMVWSAILFFPARFVRRRWLARSATGTREPKS